MIAPPLPTAAVMRQIQEQPKLRQAAPGYNIEWRNKEALAHLLETKKLDKEDKMDQLESMWDGAAAREMTKRKKAKELKFSRDD